MSPTQILVLPAVFFPGGTAPAVDLVQTFARRFGAGASGGGTCFSTTARVEVGPTVPDDSSATASPEASRLLISLATYNEAGNLRPLVETIRAVRAGSLILVIDDNSPDGTGQIADELRESLTMFT